jgi:anti-sigma28 factor (negative regulator of flagellin synthesis)
MRGLERRPYKMEISLIGKPKALKPGHLQDPLQDSVRGAKSEEGEKAVAKSKTDSAEISSVRAGAFEDKRLSVAKSTLLYELAVDTPGARVNELKERVKNGEYYVAGEYLADSMLD